MVGNFSIAQLLGLAGKNGRNKAINLGNSEQGIMGTDITLERIKDLIIEAYAQIDTFKREQHLVKADDLERRLVTEYKSRGLKQTANNIAQSLELHKKTSTNNSY